jgi:hypothetical protein
MFNVGVGEWDAVQSNGWTTRFTLQQGPGQQRFTGSAVGTHPGVSTVMIGSGTGEVTPGFGGPGAQFSFTVNWQNGPVAKYVGTFGLDRAITGLAFAVNDPVHSANWVSSRSFPEL